MSKLFHTLTSTYILHVLNITKVNLTVE